MPRSTSLSLSTSPSRKTWPRLLRVDLEDQEDLEDLEDQEDLEDLPQLLLQVVLLLQLMVPTKEVPAPPALVIVA